MQSTLFQCRGCGWLELKMARHPRARRLFTHPQVAGIVGHLLLLVACRFSRASVDILKLRSKPPSQASVDVKKIAKKCHCFWGHRNFPSQNNLVIISIPSAGVPDTIPCTRALVWTILPGLEMLLLRPPSLLEKKLPADGQRNGRT